MNHESPRHQHSACKWNRRALIHQLGLGATIVVVGCLDQNETTAIPASTSIGDEAVCSVCGMLIAGSFGPNGQVVYDGEYSSDSSDFVFYDSVRELYFDVFAQEAHQIESVVEYVTDYATVETATETYDGRTYISGYTGSDSFVKSTDAVFVIQSKVHGAMGPELIPFSDESMAQSFIDTYDGQIISREEVTQSVIESLT